MMNMKGNKRIVNICNLENINDYISNNNDIYYIYINCKKLTAGVELTIDDTNKDISIITKLVNENKLLRSIYIEILNITKDVCIVSNNIVIANSVRDYLTNNNLFDVINLHFIDHCNYKCKHCFAHKNNIEMSFEDIKVTVDKIKNYYVSKNIVGRINLVGGEIFLSKNLQNIIDYIYNLNIKISIVTNAHLLTEEFIKLNSKKIDIIGISVDSINKDINISIGRSCNKVILDYKRLVLLCKCIKENNIKLKINMCLLKTNINEDITQFLKEIEPDRIKIFQMQYIPGQNDNAKSLLISNDEFLVAAKKYVDLRATIETSDEINNSYIMINSKAEVYFNASHGILGNILKDNLTVLLNDTRIDSKSFNKRYKKGE